MTDDPAPDSAAWYRETREGLTDLTAGLDDETLRTPVPATPDWTIRDVVAHVSGIIADLRAGNLDGVGTDPWTAAQVSSRAGRPFTAVLAEWADQAPQIEEQLATWPPELAAQLIGDLAVHDLDVRGALGRTDRRETPAVGVAFDLYAHRLGTRLAEANIGALLLDAPEAPTIVGGDDPAATVQASRFELLRALTGRRSLEQVRGYGWDRDPAPYLTQFSTYAARVTPLVE